MGEQDNVLAGLKTAFIHGGETSPLAMQPALVYNDYKEGRKVLAVLEEELLGCSSFSMSVAFITKGGIIPLLQTLKELESKGIPGRILTTDYLNFSAPEALDLLQKFSNISLRMFRTTEGEGFHTKGYIFQRGETYRFIIGSSNLTMDAITRNKEWNTRLVSMSDGQMGQDVIQAFERLWSDPHSAVYTEICDTYREQYRIAKEQKKIALSTQIPQLEEYRLVPNEMQTAFVVRMKKLVENGAKKLLLLSATGTGKTYAAAFAMRDLKPKRFLFVVHREQIARKAMESFRQVLGNAYTYGILSGGQKDQEATALFATMQTISKESYRNQLEKNRYDIIIIDEAHHAGASSYQTLMDYFSPQIWLGMTATPDRMDQFNVYECFDYQIAYEIRLQKALELDMLCPFHYFGITDLVIEGESIEDKTTFSRLVSDVRVDHIIRQSKYFGFQGDRLRGLIFCRSREEGRILSDKFNLRGYRTVFLSGLDDQQVREEAISRLEHRENEKALDYIITVDIFNEGVDIPGVNQVILLRPTQSPVVFVQQLGRGLRKAPGKECVVVLDFIGNYENNFMIPIALSGDRSYNKDTIRRYVREGAQIIPGASTIHFDEISKKRIFQSVDQIKIGFRFLKEKYELLKNKLGRIPDMIDFYEYGEVDPLLFVAEAGSYYQFLKRADISYQVCLSQEETQILAFVSQMFLNGKRVHELLLLKLLMEKENVTLSDFQEALSGESVPFRLADYDSALHLLEMQFLNRDSEVRKFKSISFFQQEDMTAGLLRRGTAFYLYLQERPFYKELCKLIEFGMHKWRAEYMHADQYNLVLYQKYSRKDVCRLLNWEKDDSATIYGYRIKYDTCPIFVTYEKEENISDSTKYADHFLNEQIFSWMTRNRVSLDSKEAQTIIHYRENGLKLFLFVKKSDGEGTDFYYMGPVEPVAWQETTIKSNTGADLPVVNFKFKLVVPVRNDIYEYFTL